MSGGILLSKRRTVWERDGRACHYCKTPMTLEQATADHIWPKALHGVDANWNLVAACADCNTRFGDRTDKCDCGPCDLARSLGLSGLNRRSGPPVTIAQALGWRRTGDGWERIPEHREASA